jgi:plastocyanin
MLRPICFDAPRGCAQVWVNNQLAANTSSMSASKNRESENEEKRRHFSRSGHCPAHRVRRRILAGRSRRWPRESPDDRVVRPRLEYRGASGQPVNHAVLPMEIKIKAGGVVDFAVGGFHDVVIFKPGFTLEQLVQAGGGQYPSTPPLFVIPPNPSEPLPPAISFLAESIYYRGINPAGGPLQTVATANPSNAINRGEPVTFLERGVYLVICNVRPHLLDGMYAYVKVD